MLTTRSDRDDARAPGRRPALAIGAPLCARDRRVRQRLAERGGVAAGNSLNPDSTADGDSGPPSVQATLTGDAAVSGPLAMGSVHFVNCELPTLKGEVINAFENLAGDTTVGVLLTLRAGTIDVRLARGSATTYTERTFEGTGVTSFSPAVGAQFSSSLTELPAAGSSKGTLGAISSISGSVSCGTFQPGSASITVVGDTVLGPINASLTMTRVICGGSGATRFVTVNALATVGSTPVTVAVGGGKPDGATFFVAVSTATVNYEYTSAVAGIVTLTDGGATYNGSATEVASSTGAAGRVVKVSGSATCGTPG